MLWSHICRLHIPLPPRRTKLVFVFHKEKPLGQQVLPLICMKEQFHNSCQEYGTHCSIHIPNSNVIKRQLWGRQSFANPRADKGFWQWRHHCPGFVGQPPELRSQLPSLDLKDPHLQKMWISCFKLCRSFHLIWSNFHLILIMKPPEVLDTSEGIDTPLWIDM